MFFKTLRGTEGFLSLADARVRDAFMKPLGVQVDDMVADRKKIYERFSKKNPDGTPNTADGNFHFEADILEVLNKELEIFANEEVEVEFVWGVTGGKLRDIMEKSQYKPMYGEVQEIDEIIKQLAPPTKEEK